VHTKLDEKITLTCGKDGGVQNLEVLGMLSVRLATEDEGKVRIAIRNGDNRNLQIQVYIKDSFTLSFY
jgi:coatomer subunit delta